MSEVKGRIMQLFDDAKDYGKAKLQLLILNTIGKSAKALAALMANIIRIFFILFFVILGSIAAAIAVGSLMNCYALGFVIIAGFYLLLALVSILIKKQFLIKPLTSAFLKTILNILDDDDEGNDKKDKKS